MNKQVDFANIYERFVHIADNYYQANIGEDKRSFVNRGLGMLHNYQNGFYPIDKRVDTFLQTSSFWKLVQELDNKIKEGAVIEDLHTLINQKIDLLEKELQSLKTLIRSL